MNAVITERLVGIAQQSRSLPHGGKSEFYARVADELGMSIATLHRKLGEVSVRQQRKRRNDAGKIVLLFDDAQLISAVLMESTRRNNKRLMSIQQAMDILIANGKIAAARVDEETGEMIRLSVSTVARALRHYKLHPDQLNAPAPVTEMQSLHPNHVWEIDPSLCVLYYLKSEADANRGLQVMDADEFYKNKPKNLARIAQDRVWRYVITDHTSGTVYVEYVLGAESGENLANIFIHAVQKRGEHDPFHGVPFIVMVDPGSANTGAVFKNLCRSLQVHVQVNKPGNPRAKGQVERMNDQVERQFESGLKFIAINSLEELNQAAWRWMRVFNATSIHSRTKQTRYGVWLQINQEQLRTAPDEATCRELAHSKPESRSVTPKLTISFKGDEYDVSSLIESAGLFVGQKVMVVKNPWRQNAAQIVIAGEDGRDVFHVVEKVERNEFGFRDGAPVICESYSRHADTKAQRNAKDNEMLVMGADTLEAAAEARKGKHLAFGGELDPYKPVTDTVLPAYLPKRGTALNVPNPVQIEIKPLNRVQIGKALREIFGRPVTTEEYASIADWYPSGVMEEQLQEAADRLEGKGKFAAPALRLVG
ncbi:MAG: integrase [Gallionella sp.]|nr:integrase [Gallionella sp.]MDD4946446.1 integrase [Gallionella sp.]